MSSDKERVAETKAAPALMLTENLLRSILLNEGIPQANAVPLSRRICASLPDLPSLVKHVEDTVVEHLMAELQVDMTQKIMTQLQGDTAARSDHGFGKIDDALCERIDARARELLEDRNGCGARAGRCYELSLVRANRPQADEERPHVLVLTSEEKLDGSRGA
jgi:hypothetical protein